MIRLDERGCASTMDVTRGDLDALELGRKSVVVDQVILGREEAWTRVRFVSHDDRFEARVVMRDSRLRVAVSPEKMNGIYGRSEWLASMKLTAPVCFALDINAERHFYDARYIRDCFEMAAGILGEAIAIGEACAPVGARKTARL